jgi:hydroxymethylbilane synthase
MRTGIVVGSRGSQLSLVQTKSVIAKIREANPRLNVNLRKITTTGDRDSHSRLEGMGVAVFVKELEQALLSGTIDLAVHSLKDLPVDIPSRLSLVAVTKRLDPRDALVAASKLDDLVPGSRIGTGSPRRTVQLSRYRPDLEVYGIRGNVDTRLRKLASGEVDGIIVAAAAMVRLGREEKITEYLPPEHFLPAAGQGALALEARLGDEETAGLVAPLNHGPTRQSVTAERAFFRAMGGGCHAPMAALGVVNGATLKLEGMVASHDGRKILQASVAGNAISPEEVGTQLANKMLSLGASRFMDEVRKR